MKNKKTLFAIIGVIAIVIIAVIILQNNNTKDSQTIETKPQKVLYTEPQIPEYGKKFKIFYNSEENIDKPVFKLNFIIPQGAKIYNVVAKYDKEKKQYYAEFDVPHKSFYLIVEAKGLNEAQMRQYTMTPCKSNEGGAYHNYALRIMSDPEDYQERIKIYENDSLNYPYLYERYTDKWKWNEYYRNPKKIEEDISTLEKKKIDRSMPLSYISHSFALINGYAITGKIDKYREKIQELDEEITKNKDHLEYFDNIPILHLTAIVRNSFAGISNDSNQKAQEIGMALLKPLIEVAMKHKISTILYDFAKRLDANQKVSRSIDFKEQFAKVLLDKLNDDLASKDYCSAYHSNVYLMISTIKLLNEINNKQYDEQLLKLINRSYGFIHKNRFPKISKDTNDYCTVFNGNDGSYLSIINLKAKWFFDRDNEESGISVLESGINSYFENKYGKDTKLEIIGRIVDYYYKIKDLGKVEQYTLKLIEIEEKEASKQFNKKVIPLRKELKEKVLTFDEFKRLNSVYTPPTKSAPNVNITHSSGTVNPSKMGDVDLVFVSIDEQCQRCNDDIPGIIEALSKKKNVKLFFITDISKKGIYNAFDHEVDVIKKNEPNLKAIYYDRYKDDRIIIVRKNKLYIEATTLTGKELVDKYF